ncbi:class I SAM-dependent methyltransferase [Capnocytophaga cynodegmi]|uniref:3,4-dihydroxy-5-hexaprenylbenzoate methyltransferase n=1 Tax=Capnocytophaga cynodegmi TaxID=28189 RepID=A0A0B7HD22_9FLAO|nr:class I SAM-dependent methyltransferase [Capnocytophaga cynodegmi]CEN35478.1 3,4-dihydroxy-5-hexaprenylbenzoate methyltransferase [Capnocytophaga cynodegmi]
MKIKDYSISQEEFELIYDSNLELLKTQPIPKNLSKYYESDVYISHTDSKKTLFDKVYQAVKNINLKSKIRIISKYKKEKIQLLDIGAGTGDFVLSCKKQMNWETTGIEPNEKARQLAEKKQIRLLENYDDLKEKSFDVITLWHVLEHIPDLENQIQKINSLLKEDGILIVAVPNYKSWDAQHYKQFWAAYDVPRHLWHFSKTSIQKIFIPKGFQLLEIKPMLFDAFYVSILSEQYKTGKKNFIKGFINGTHSNLYGMRKKEFSSHIYVLQKVKNDF